MKPRKNRRESLIGRPVSVRRTLNSYGQSIILVEIKKMFKKVSLIIVAFTLACGPSLSGEVFLGAKKGINLGFQSGYDSGSSKPGFMIGYSGGILVEIPLTRSLIIQPEILFSRKGRGVYSTSHTERTYLNYIDFPVIIKFRLLHAPIVWSFYSGAQLSAALGGNVYVEESNETTFFSNDEIHGIDAGLIIGTEVGLPIGGSRIFLDLRYASGILPALKYEKARNQVFSLYLGYGFTL